MILLPVLLQAAGIAASTPPTAPVVLAPADGDVVVTADRLSRSERELKACVARKCPPREDIAASIAHAENLFVAGEYQGARDTLRFSRGRNKRYAAELPVPVAELLRLDAFVATLMGRSDYGRIGTIDSVSALKAGLPSDDPRIATQRLLVAGVFAREGRFRTAVNMYDAVADRAHEQGWAAIRAQAIFQAAALYTMFGTVDAEFKPEARERVRELLALKEPEARQFQDAVALLDIRTAQMSKDDKKLAVARERVRALRSDTAVLAYAPPIILDTAPNLSSVVPTIYDIKDQWIDFSFRVAPDGSVRDVAEVDRGAHASGRWIELARKSLAGRQYLALNRPDTDPGLDQMERFILTSSLTSATESRISLNGGAPVVRSVMLSGEPSRGGTGQATASD